MTTTTNPKGTDTMKTAPFTNTTWADVKTVNRGSNLGWMDQDDLADELASLVANVDKREARTLIAAAASGMPIELTFQSDFQTFNGTIREETTAVGIIEHLRPSTNIYDAIRFITWGLYYTLDWSRFKSCRVLHATYNRIED